MAASNFDKQQWEKKIELHKVFLALKNHPAAQKRVHPEIMDPYERARKMHDKVLKDLQYIPEFYFRVGECYFVSKLYHEAAQLFVKAIEANDNSHDEASALLNICIGHLASKSRPINPPEL